MAGLTSSRCACYCLNNPNKISNMLLLSSQHDVPPLPPQGGRKPCKRQRLSSMNALEFLFFPKGGHKSSLLKELKGPSFKAMNRCKTLADDKGRNQRRKVACLWREGNIDPKPLSSSLINLNYNRRRKQPRTNRKVGAIEVV